MKKYICFFMAFSIFAVTLCGCGERDMNENEVFNPDLYSTGLEIASLIAEKASSEDWADANGVNDNVKEFGEKIAEGDYSKPTKVYEITIDDEKKFEYKMGLSKVSSDIKKEMKTAFFSGIPNIVTGAYGTLQLAASATYTATKLFVNNDLKEDMLYIYCFDDGYPICVSFTKGEDGAVLAKGTVGFGDDFVDKVKEIEGLKIREL